MANGKSLFFSSPGFPSASTRASWSLGLAFRGPKHCTKFRLRAVDRSGKGDFSHFLEEAIHFYRDLRPPWIHLCCQMRGGYTEWCPVFSILRTPSNRSFFSSMWNLVFSFFFLFFPSSSLFVILYVSPPVSFFFCGRFPYRTH